MNRNYIVCKKVYFYSQLDEDIFFTWIKSISCIKKFEGAGDELYLDLVDRELSYEDMKNLIALLYRYKIKMDQLQSFVTDNNRAAVEPWKKQIYKATK
jgi:hypothetical protein